MATLSIYLSIGLSKLIVEKRISESVDARRRMTVQLTRDRPRLTVGKPPVPTFAVQRFTVVRSPPGRDLPSQDILFCCIGRVVVATNDLESRRTSQRGTRTITLAGARKSTITCLAVYIHETKAWFHLHLKFLQYWGIGICKNVWDLVTLVRFSSPLSPLQHL